MVYWSFIVNITIIPWNWLINKPTIVHSECRHSMVHVSPARYPFFGRPPIVVALLDGAIRTSSWARAAQPIGWHSSSTCFGKISWFCDVWEVWEFNSHFCVASLSLGPLPGIFSPWLGEAWIRTLGDSTPFWWPNGWRVYHLVMTFTVCHGKIHHFW